MTTEAKSDGLSLEELNAVSGGAKGVVQTVSDAIHNAFKPDAKELARSSGCLGAADNRFNGQQ